MVEHKRYKSICLVLSGRLQKLSHGSQQALSGRVNLSGYGSLKHFIHKQILYNFMQTNTQPKRNTGASELLIQSMIIAEEAARD